jgi:hypothetical protein
MGGRVNRVGGYRSSWPGLTRPPTTFKMPYGRNSVGGRRLNTWQPFLKPIRMSGSSAIAVASLSVSSRKLSGFQRAWPALSAPLQRWFEAQLDCS